MSQLAMPVESRDHILGRAEAPVAVVEYLDYECPFCARAHHVVTDVLTRVGDEVRYVPRHFPLSQLHPHAILAAQAAEAAASQGRFWPMHATLFENQDALDFESLLIYAEALGLDVERVTYELRSGTHMPKVQEDYSSGVNSEVNGTPSFFINGVRQDAWDRASLLDAVERAARQSAPQPEHREHRVIRR